MEFKDLTPEQQQQALNANTPDEILSLAREAGYELSEEELDAVAGGRKWGEPCNEWICGVIGH